MNHKAEPSDKSAVPYPRKQLPAKLKCWFVFVGLLSVATCYAQDKPRSNPLTSEAYLKSQRRELPDYTWVNEKWTSSDRPYIAIRGKIDKEIASTKGGKEKLTALVKRYEGAALAKPSSSQAQFAWAYAAREASRAGLFLDPWSVPRDISYAMAAVPSSRSYQYARLRFMIAMWWQPFHQLKPVALRLVRRNPKDYSVKYHALSALSASHPGEERKLVLSYVQDLVRMRPNSAASYSSIAYVYTKVFYGDHDIAAGDKTIAAYRKWLELTPPTEANAQDRRITEQMIKNIQKYQAEWAKKG